MRRYAYAEAFPERARRAPGPSILDPYLAHLEARHAAGGENAGELWRELRGLGFSGSRRQVHRWLRDRRRAPSKHTPWSSAQAEGHMTKLTLLKRQMYGRATSDLLRRRVLLAA